MSKQELPTSLKIYLRAIRTPDKRKEFLELYHYIQHLAGDFDVTVSEADILEMFGMDNATFPSKIDINKRLFKLAQTDTVKKAAADFDIAIINSMCTNYFSNAGNKEQLQRSIRNSQTSINRCNDDIRSYVTAIIDAKRQLVSMETSDHTDTFLREINKIISSNKFEQIYYYLPTHTLCAVTKPVNIRYGEVDYSLGQYVIAFTSYDKRFHVYPHKNNIIAEGVGQRIHPHVFESREICWGNASATYAELMSSQKIGELFLIANMILHAYNRDSPVNPIETFKNDKTCPVTRNTILYVTDYPVHTQFLIDLYPELKTDKLLLSTYVARIKNVHNFSYKLTDDPVQEITPEENIENNVSEIISEVA